MSIEKGNYTSPITKHSRIPVKSKSGESLSKWHKIQKPFKNHNIRRIQIIKSMLQKKT